MGTSSFEAPWRRTLKFCFRPWDHYRQPIWAEWVGCRNLSMNPLLWPARSCANGLGMAWWARVETQSPDFTYWFGPFLRRRSLESQLVVFLSDLRAEAPGELGYTVVRRRRGEPLTEPGLEPG